MHLTKCARQNLGSQVNIELWILRTGLATC